MLTGQRRVGMILPGCEGRTGERGTRGKRDVRRNSMLESYVAWKNNLHS